MQKRKIGGILESMAIANAPARLVAPGSFRSFGVMVFFRGARAIAQTTNVGFPFFV
jgi:hypothetical protein